MKSIDGEAPLQRCLDSERLKKIIAHPLFKEVHFYEAGARLLRFTGQNVFTHTRYIDCEGDRERALTHDERKNPGTLEKIRRTANKHRNAASELAAVHQLFGEFAITRSQHLAGKLALIDVE